MMKGVMITIAEGLKGEIALLTAPNGGRAGSSSSRFTSAMRLATAGGTLAATAALRLKSTKT